MFESAVLKAEEYTHPYVVSTRLGDGSCPSFQGAYIVVNSEWAITAAHTFLEVDKLNASHRKWQEFESERKRVEADKSLKPSKRKQLSATVVLDRKRLQTVEIA